MPAIKSPFATEITSTVFLCVLCGIYLLLVAGAIAGMARSKSGDFTPLA